MKPIGIIANLGPAELGIILALVLLLFGAAKLPKLARSLGQAQREFKKGLTEDTEADNPNGSSHDSTTQESHTAQPATSTGNDTTLPDGVKHEKTDNISSKATSSGASKSEN